MRCILSFVIVVVSVLPMIPRPAVAADFHVTTAVDTVDGVCNNHCSLRDAIQAANVDPGTNDTIYLKAARYELTIPGINEEYANTGDLDIRTSMSFIGKGPGKTIIDANSIDRVFDIVVGGVDVLFRGVTITGGWLALQTDPNGSGLRIFSSNSNVDLETVILENNYSSSSEVTGGGAIFAYQTNLDIRNSILRSNSAGRGGAIYITGVNAYVTIERSAIHGNTCFDGKGNIDNIQGTVVIYTSTVSSNYAYSGNGGVRNYYGTTYIIQSTLSGNTNAEVVAESGSPGLVTLTRSIINGHCWVGDPSAIDSDWYNLESPGNTCQLEPFYDTFNVADAMIGSLSWNGGPTPTHLPEPLSPAVDTTFLGQFTCSGPDQRWIARPRDGEADPDAIPECDVGAVERVPGGLFFGPFECGYTTAWSAAVP